MTNEQYEEIKRRAYEFCIAAAPDLIDASLAAVDEALFAEGNTDPMYRGRLRRECLRQIGLEFLRKAAGEEP